MPLYLFQNGEPAGPFDNRTLAAMLADGTASATDLAWEEGMEEWKPLNEIREIAFIVEEDSTAAPVARGAAVEACAYKRLADELSHGNYYKAAWLRACAEANGDDEQAKILYSRHRVAMLKKSMSPVSDPSRRRLAEKFNRGDGRRVRLRRRGWLASAGVLAFAAAIYFGSRFWLRSSDGRPSSPDDLASHAAKTAGPLDYRGMTAAELTPLAEKGDPEGQYHLGVCYYTGKGVVKDTKEAAKWFGLAAEQGDAEAQFNLGVALASGDGVVKDSIAAVKWFRKAAEQGHAEAQFSLGVCYNNGEGIAKDAAEARKWDRLAAAQGNAKAQFNLGVACQDGNGVPKDAEAAMEWYRKAAEQGHAKAQYNLGVAYGSGFGVSKDAKEAVKWYRIAAESGYAAAQFNLGVHYLQGDGVEQDYIEACRWAILAAAHGVEPAKQAISVIQTRMTPDQIASAQRLAFEFQPRKPGE